MPKWSFVLVALLFACGGGNPQGPDTSDVTEVEVWTPPAPELWPAGASFEVKGALAAAVPDAFAISTWVSHVTASERPTVGQLAAFGTGNGLVFGLIGYPRKGPLNTLHSLTGPTYERGERYFGDYSLHLLVDGAERTFDEEWVTRSLAVPAVLTRGRADSLEVETVDLALHPWLAMQEPPLFPMVPEPLTRCFLRLVTVRNNGDVLSAPLALRVDAANPGAGADGDRLVEASSERALSTEAGPDAVAAGKMLTLSLGALAAHAEVTRVVTHCTAEGTVPPEALPAEVWTTDPASWLDGMTTVAMVQPTAESASFDLPDARVAHFLYGMTDTLIAQTASTGATCPMSQYTRTWARDNIGPTLLLLDLGLTSQVAALLDYVWGATLIKGDLQNSYDADLDLMNLPPEPDWASLGPLAVRVGAETPSYLVMMHGLYWRATGDLERARTQWGLLRRAMLDVRFDVDRLLPWTGDETFRAAMNTSFGLGLDVPHHDISFSLNSTILWLAAAKHFEALAAALGKPEDAAAAHGIAVEMALKALPHYQLADGCLSALVDRATLATWPAPFEDASLIPTWAGWLDGDDPQAIANVQCLIERLGRAPGVLQSAIDPTYVGFPLLPSEEGVFTGMKPGFTLAALTDVGHPDAEAAFNALRRSLDAGGNVDEYLLYSSELDVPYSGLTLFYNPQGLEPSDYTAKFRPWEGGIDASAVFHYLTGFVPDIPNGRLSFRPHLPNQWPHAAYYRLGHGDELRFDLEVTRTSPHHVQVTVRSRFDTSVKVSLRWDSAGPVTATVVAHPQVDAPEVIERFGRTSTTFAEVTLTSGSSLTWEIEETAP